MITETLEQVLDPKFLGRALDELRKSGFVTDEHDFAPYRETITRFAPEIEAQLRRHGTPISLGSGIIRNHAQAGYAYFIFDKDRFPTAADAERAVSEWLDRAYADRGE